MEITQTLTKFFLICSKIKNDKTILYNCYGETVEKKLNFAYIWIDKNLGEAIYFSKYYLH